MTSDENVLRPELDQAALFETASLFGEESGPPVATALSVKQPASQQTLYRKWRSQTFQELVGQEAITRTLQNAIAAGRVAHAYLFCGPRGTGKTSTGRLLAKAVNCLHSDPRSRPCDHCEACRSIAEARAMDLIEIDAASNRGIDEVRELRDKINYQPAVLKKKVYIIDEVHMMTDAAFNALLKTLEEPPPHALFILATTDPQDIPATVVSRCQRFDFQRIGLEQIASRLGFICGEEDIKFETAALDMVARQATGSLRDALSLLDQLIVFSGGNITIAAVRQMLGVMNIEAVADFVDALVAADIAAGLENINRLVQAGTDLKRFNRELVEHLRNLMLLKVNPGTRDLADMTAEAHKRLSTQAGRLDTPVIVRFLRVFSGVDYNLKVSPYGQLPLELALMESLLPPAQEAGFSRPASVPEPARPTAVYTRAATPLPAQIETNGHSPSLTSVRQEPLPAVASPPAVTVSLDSSASETKPEAEAIALELEVVLQAWQQVVKSVEAQSKILSAMLKDCRPTAVKGNRVALSIAYTFHYSRINSDATRRSIEDHFSTVLGQRVLVDCIDDSSSGPSVRPVERSRPVVDERTRQISEIFNARVLDDN